MKANCAHCGKEISVPPSQMKAKQGRTCSRQCYLDRKLALQPDRKVDSLGYVWIKTEKGMKLEHRVIAGAEQGMVVHHKDGDKTNNDPSNLEILTDSEHRSMHQRRETNVFRRYSDEQIRAVRQRLSEGYSLSVVAKEFHMNRDYVWRLSKRLSRADVI